ncbi:tRNA threonylcarbamoyladenosine biosynthesis protein TsaE [Inhella inkyongensis]|uniref:tRNA threonylcarbamoyladenosine biosynthesis protein TsaE n=1 Tax=Inhella inkyongensis TaxID=392593 RepID=A0A840SA30_9BURK|nr:tRNA (adenosine(37)-N6)-threonylcarbamoyltransferase complex ATPase subunit type 1 TsaE [Inhella inkyongensis]MBB5205361.1 tRNA threonylcarbamoyladenosine biosynthesis protein TsaE [Inhella inkyongensis]
MTLILETRTLHWPDEAATETAAQALARSPELMPALILLEGGLGAGKTTWVRHLLRALGVTGRIKSPSYAVLESYAPPAGPVHHFDFYRFSDPREWEDAGFREILAGEGLKLVEWPEHAEGLLPQADLRLQIQDEAAEHVEGQVFGDIEGEGRRSVSAQALSPRGRALLQALAA